MNNKYLIAKEKGVQNVSDGEKNTGYSFYARIPYYMGASLSSVVIFKVAMDGKEEAAENISVTIDGMGTFRVVDFPTITKFWPYGIPQKVTVLKDGGLAPGKHELYFEMANGVIYGKGTMDVGTPCHYNFEI